MQISVRTVDDVVIVDLKGNIVIGEGDVMLKSRIVLLLEEDYKKILLNLANVKYIDSSGLGELVNTHATVTRRGGQLKLLHLTRKIRELLTITKLLLVFDHFTDEQEALESFKN